MTREEIHQTAILEEAALIFVQLREAPDDAALLAERDAFLARGPAERAAYAKIQDGWRIAGGRRRSNSVLGLLLAIGLGGAAYVGAAPLRIYLLADAYTALAVETTSLASGDLVHLDASSAILDNSAGQVRGVTLLKGAAVFDVDADPRPFAVSLGDAEVTVRGTIFETAHLGDGLSVSVAEGSVDVTIDDRTWLLEDGARLTWSPERGVTVMPISLESVGAWREQRLVVNDVTFGEIAEILDRRLPGDVFVFGASLSETRVSGSFDLQNPQSALRVLAAIADARLILAPPVASVLMRID